ncbi:hypothetical protein ACFUN7_24340 [Streptomyces sp. NPDC057236]|uniref:hypothetical protein n=1 Tax=Streptomyces sp. NPDC057236 TaxID=3346059 RepID=UPI00362B42D1
MSAQQPSPAAQPWPDGVIARYLTVGGATVDLTEKPDEITGVCWGCLSETNRFHFDPMCEGRRMESYVTRQADAWAQAHAEKCRALPRPAVTA